MLFEPIILLNASSIFTYLVCVIFQNKLFPKETKVSLTPVRIRKHSKHPVKLEKHYFSSEDEI